MKHFIGGAAIGLILALRQIPRSKSASDMGDYEFCVYVAAHLFVSFLFGVAAWGLLP